MSQVITRPSQAHIWTRCSAFPLFNSRLNFRIDVDSDPAKEGTCAAWVAEGVLKGEAKSCADFIGKTHANEWLVTSEMAEITQGYVDYVLRDGFSVEAEKQVVLSPRVKGTLDCSVIGWDSTTIKIKDLKYGLVPVYAFENDQLIIYGAAEYIRRGMPASITHAELTIYQPRSFKHEGEVDTWTITIAELMARAQRIAELAELCHQPEPVAVPGKQCKRCNVAASCVATVQTLQMQHEVIKNHSQRHMTPDELSRFLSFLELHEAIFKGVKTAIDAESEHRINNGEYVPGWSLNDRLGHRKFVKEPMEIALLTGKDPYKKVLKTPAELIRDGASEDVVKSMSIRPTIGRKLGRNNVAKLFK